MSPPLLIVIAIRQINLKMRVNDNKNIEFYQQEEVNTGISHWILSSILKQMYLELNTLNINFISMMHESCPT